MGRSQREKGKRNERLAAKAFSRIFGVKASRTAQYRGRTGVADLEISDQLHAEVKVRKSIAACRYYEQAVRDCLKGAVPFVLMREDHGDWFLMVKLEDTKTLMDNIENARKAQPVEHDTRGAAPCSGDRDRRSLHDDREA